MSLLSGTFDTAGQKVSAFWAPKNTSPVPLQELIFPSTSLQVFHAGGSITCWREDLEQCLQEGLVLQHLCTPIPVSVQPASLPAQSPRAPGDPQHVQCSAQPREHPRECQCGWKGNKSQEAFPAPRWAALGICHIPAMTSCPQIEPWRVLLVRLLPIPAMQQLQSCPAWFYTSDIQLVFLCTFQLHSSKWHGKHSCLHLHKYSALFSPKHFPPITNLCKNTLFLM